MHGPFSRSSMLLVACIGLFSIAAAPTSERGPALVVADHQLASRCGAEVLEAGGNAADAAVAAALCAGVVRPAGSGLGGGGFALIVPADRDAAVLDFREVAPAAATRDMFLDAERAVRPGSSREGGLAVAVPSESRGLAAVQARYGVLTPAAVAAPAIRLARKGFEVGPHLADAIAGTSSQAVREELSHGAYADVIQRPELARTLQRWARTGGEDLHTGAGAAQIVEVVRRAGGVLTLDDLTAVRVRERDPIVASYRGHTVLTMPPPSSGGVVLAQMLEVLEGYDLTALGRGSSALDHLLAEVMKHAYADRARVMGDPDFVEVPIADLLSDERVEAVRSAVDMERTFPSERYGMHAALPEDAGTQHISVVDRDGMAVSLTTTINTSFGSGLVVPELGVILNNQMDDFAVAPGVPNAFGLVGGDANAVAPGKHPLSSMSPTVLLGPDGRVRMVVGASGGSQIISSVLQVVIDVVDLGLAPQEAVAEPRVHHQWEPERLYLEPGTPPEVQAALEQRGHVLTVRPQYASVQVIVCGPEDCEGGADPRHGGWPAAAR